MSAAESRLALAAALVIYGDVVSQIEQAIISFFQSVWQGISSFFGTVFQAVATTFATIFLAPAQAIQASFNSLQSSVSGLGPFAPIVTILVVAAVFLIAVLLIWIVIRVSVSEGEQTGTEVEEGV